MVNIVNLICKFSILLKFIYFKDKGGVIYSGSFANILILNNNSFINNNYLVFDSTKQGLALALFVALGAPLIELLLMQSMHLWHYPDGDLHTTVAGGIVRWVPFCYFFYPPAVIQFTRYLWKSM